MDRRRFLLTSVAGAFATPLGAGAQQAGKAYRVGILWFTYPHVSDPFFKVLRDGLTALGTSKGRASCSTSGGQNGIQMDTRPSRPSL
jgi:ABC-type sugar transport system substrate-binding protein